jgi:type I restriction enzyme M protein
MIDARNVYRKVTRKINDFSPEQMQNISAIVWLYRGQQKRFLGLVKHYLVRVVEESSAIEAALAQFETTFADIQGSFDTLTSAVAKCAEIEDPQKQSLADAVAELSETTGLYHGDRKKLAGSLEKSRAIAFERSSEPC